MKPFSQSWSHGFRTSVLVAVVLFAREWAAAATFPVDAAGGDDNRGGTSAATAWTTLQHSADEVRGGDTVIVASGLYRGAIQLHSDT